MSANLQNQNPILKEVYAKMAIPPQFMKGKGNPQQNEDPRASAKKKKAAARLAMLKAKSGGK